MFNTFLNSSFERFPKPLRSQKISKSVMTFNRLVTILDSEDSNQLNNIESLTNGFNFF